MLRRNLLSEIAIRRSLELIHRDADDAAAALMRTATRCFHHAGVSTRKDREAGFSEQGSDLDCLRVLQVAFAALGAAKDGHDSFLFFAHVVTGSAGALARIAPSVAIMFLG